jgi:hypothetical protein
VINHTLFEKLESVLIGEEDETSFAMWLNIYGTLYTMERGNGNSPMVPNDGSLGNVKGKFEINVLLQVLCVC